MNYRSAVAAVFFVSSFTLALNSAWADGSETGRVTNIHIEGAVISIYLDGPDYLVECAGGARWTIAASDPLMKEKYSAILAAAAASKPITLYHVSSAGCGAGSSNRVHYVNAVFN